MAHQAGCGDRDEQLEADDSEAEPQGAVCGNEGHERVEDIELGEGVDHRRENVDDQEHTDQQREVAVQ